VEVAEEEVVEEEVVEEEVVEEEVDLQYFLHKDKPPCPTHPNPEK
jgi:hypothetical protein